jgi:hypothetical protein
MSADALSVATVRVASDYTPVAIMGAHHDQMADHLQQT